jgi:VacB/RNase II family 3'-5' exoribonuclease
VSGGSARDLRPVARAVMADEGFAPAPPADALAEAEALAPLDIERAIGQGARDLRGLLWSSIDNRESRDLDQLEYAERLPGGDIRLLVAIADVAAYVPAGSAIDRAAAASTTSVYTGVATFPMLPERLSTNLTSLIEGADRLAVVVDMAIAADGTVRLNGVARAVVHNHAKLEYITLGQWLEGAGPPPARVASVDGLEAQVRLQAEAAERLRAFRVRSGALDFDTIEANVVAAEGKVVDLVVDRKSSANELIESFMIAANTVIASFLESRGVPAIQRVIREPARWSRIVDLARTFGATLPAQPDEPALAAFLDERRQADPAGFPDLSLSLVKLIGAGEYIVERPDVEVAGHFGLAVQDYTHATAPNRRYVDLVIQRMLLALLAGQPSPYGETELAAVADQSNERARAARAVERRMRKHAAVDLMRRRVGSRFDAIVTGASRKGTFVRTLAPPVEGMVVRGADGLDVGDAVHVQLVGVDAERGFIDFAVEPT